jgi:hypothetical protein
MSRDQGQNARVVGSYAKQLDHPKGTFATTQKVRQSRPLQFVLLIAF